MLLRECGELTGCFQAVSRLFPGYLICDLAENPNKLPDRFHFSDQERWTPLFPDVYIASSFVSSLVWLFVHKRSANKASLCAFLRLLLPPRRPDPPASTRCKVETITAKVSAPPRPPALPVPISTPARPPSGDL